MVGVVFQELLPSGGIDPMIVEIEGEHNNILFCELSFSNIMGSFAQPNNGSFRNWSVKKTTPSTSCIPHFPQTGKKASTYFLYFESWADLGFSRGGLGFQKTFEKFADLFLGRPN